MPKKKTVAVPLGLLALGVGLYVGLRTDSPAPKTTTTTTSCTKTLAAGGALPAFLASLTSGQTGCLRAGSYTANTSLAASNVTVRSYPGERAKINGYLLLKNTANGTQLRDLDLDGTTGTTSWTLLIQADDVTLYGLDVTNRKTGGVNAICITAGYGWETTPANTASRLTVDHVRVHNCGDDNHEHGIYLESTRAARIVDSWFYDNPGMGISFYPDAQGTLVERVLIDGNSSACKQNLGFAGERAGREYTQNHASSNNVVRDSLITNARCRYNVDDYYPAPSPLPVGNVVAFNCVWNAPFGNYGHGTSIVGYTQRDNLNLNPLYTDRANKDFRLQPGSPCAGKGPR